MNGTFTLLVRGMGTDFQTGKYRTLALRENETWDEICDHLTAMGDDPVIALVTNDRGQIVLRCQPMGMFGPLIDDL